VKDGESEGAVLKTDAPGKKTAKLKVCPRAIKYRRRRGIDKMESMRQRRTDMCSSQEWVDVKMGKHLEPPATDETTGQPL
jgi:hypothetical protein